jgi:hypothetical protein
MSDNREWITSENAEVDVWPAGEPDIDGDTANQHSLSITVWGSGAVFTGSKDSLLRMVNDAFRVIETLPEDVD